MNTVVTPAKKFREGMLAKRITALMWCLLLEAILYFLSPPCAELMAMLAAYVTNTSPTSQAAVLILDICDLIMYCVTFILPTLIYCRAIKVRPLRLVSYLPRMPKRPITSVLVPLGVITLAGYASNVFISALEVCGIGTYGADAPFPTDTAALIVYFIASVIAPAVIEEFVYRGVVLRSLVPFGRGFAVVASGLFFGVMHFNPSQIIYATCAGIAIGAVSVNCRSMWLPVIIHFINNGISFLLHYIYDVRGEAAYYTFVSIYDAVIIILAAAAFAALCLKLAREPDTRRPQKYTQSEKFRAFLTPPAYVYVIAAVYLTSRWLYFI